RVGRVGAARVRQVPRDDEVEQIGPVRGGRRHDRRRHRQGLETGTIAMSAVGGKGRRSGRACALPLAVAFGLLVTACSSSGPQFGDNHRARYHRGQPSYKVGAAYQINGVWYHPRVDYDYDETGLASWYGEAFDGQATANGEIYDLNQLSAAHKTLPLPSVVEVTNLRNGRSLRLRVND